ncbi:MAG: class I SAM-dependent methyltransferase [Candidatus Rokubacteria bacterium]|nr:class I SAM-dependent methyltransferase [Candidatus Rokubacteria bacterium]
MMGILDRRQKCRKLIQRYYRGPSREELLDSTAAALARPSDVLLDAGCGADFPLLSRYGPKVAFAVGVDLCSPAPNVLGRTKVIVGNLESLPIRSQSVDLIVSRSVVEHLDHPVETFKEFGRVLRSGGRLVFTTPNKYYYSCLVALLTPGWLKDVYFQKVFGGDAYAHFPVRYRANTARASRDLARVTGFELTRTEAIEHYPYYLMFSPALFRLGILYDEIVRALGFTQLQSTWLVVMEKK